MGLGLSWLDIKLGLRMLFKQPGLTLAAILALAIGIPLGVLPMHILDAFTTPPPVEDGEDIVILHNYDLSEFRPLSNSNLHEFVRWREGLSSFEDLAMWRTNQYAVGSLDGLTTPVVGAEVTASFFSLLRVPPLLGRPLTEADEVIGAPGVVVIGYDFWQSRVGGDPDIVGRPFRIGTVLNTVVGVMPQGFGFPVRHHLWLPLRYNVLQYERGQGPTGRIMGRLADGVSITEARTEIELAGQRMAAEFPDTHARLKPLILDYTGGMTGMKSIGGSPEVYLIQVLALLMLGLACANVGILILARTASRSGEFAIRTALGASRVRIVSQLFIESLLLATMAAGVGLFIIQLAATQTRDLLTGFPGWISLDVSLKTAVFAMSLAAGSAVLAGVVPVLKATGKGVQGSMQRASGGGSGLRFGVGSSVLIVTEVTASVWFLIIGLAVLPFAFKESLGLGLQTDQYLAAALQIPREDPMSDQAEFDGRVAVAHEELVRRLSAEPGLGPVAIADYLPGMSHPLRRVEIEGVPQEPGSRGRLVNVARVDVGYFDALDKPILSGRNFHATDLGEDHSAIIVNTNFVDRFLEGRNPLGQRVRYWTRPGQDPEPWFEIVGVVEQLGMNAMNPKLDQGLYHVVAPGELYPVRFAVQVGDNPEGFTPRLRSIVTETYAGASIAGPSSLDKVLEEERYIARMLMLLAALLAGAALVLSFAGLHAVMSFTVANRTREIGIRTALGAQPANIVSVITKRAFLQLCVGVVIGAALSWPLTLVSADEAWIFNSSNWLFNVGGIALSVLVVGMLTCVSPTLRGLRIRPVEALMG